MDARRTALPLLWAALSCLPSDDLSRYSAEWSDDVSGGGGAPDGAGNTAGELAGDSGSGAGSPGTSNGGGEGVVGGGTLPLAGAPGAGLEPGSAVGDAGIGAGGSGGGSNTGGTTGEPSADTCPDGVLGEDGSACYRVSLSVAAWQDAQAECVLWQGALVALETPEEDAFIDGLVTQSIWIGGSDTQLDNVYVWTTGAPMTVGNWGPNQPDRFPGPDCIEKREAAFARQWFDQPCENARAFVCEKAATPAP